MPLPRLFRRLLLVGAAALLPVAAIAATAPPEIAPDEAQARARAGEVTLIDVRTPPEWRETGVVPGAARINMHHPQGADGFLKDVLGQVGGDRDAPIAVICRSGNRSMQVQRFLTEQGFTRVQSVAEGMSGSRSGPGWIRRGLPIEPCSRC